MTIDIKGFSGMYTIDEYGNVFSYYTMRYLNHYTSDRKYKLVKLTICKKSKYYSLHRLLAEHFIPNPNNYPIINHIDGNPSNNSLDNLEWCTQSHNVKHAHDTGLTKKYPDKCLVLEQKEIEEIRAKYVPYYYPAIKLAKEYKVSEDTIYRIIKNKKKYGKNN